jgi:hypothetical protein
MDTDFDAYLGSILEGADVPTDVLAEAVEAVGGFTPYSPEGGYGTAPVYQATSMDQATAMQAAVETPERCEDLVTAKQVAVSTQTPSVCATHDKAVHATASQAGVATQTDRGTFTVTRGTQSRLEMATKTTQVGVAKDLCRHGMPQPVILIRTGSDANGRPYTEKRVTCGRCAGLSMEDFK